MPRFIAAFFVKRACRRRAKPDPATPIEFTRNHDGNADNLLAFAAGTLCQSMEVDLVVIGTGDGQLAEDVAEAIGMLPAPRLVATLSLAGSTAARLDARHSSLIAANLEIGRDCLVAV